MNNKDKSLAFSNGEFEKIYGFIADNAVWTVVEEHTFTGKKQLLTIAKKLQIILSQ